MKTQCLAALVAGILFGVGLAISGMTQPAIILGFLDVAGVWDPTLMFVLCGAVGVTVIAFRFVLRRSRPLLDSSFHVAATNRVDASLLIGAAIFGIGWGLAGFCPGPALVALAAGAPLAIVFVIAMVCGSLLQYFFASRAKIR
jgi:uncharacterized membrane protein YedE/YeeE